MVSINIPGYQGTFRDQRRKRARNFVSGPEMATFQKIWASIEEEAQIIARRFQAIIDDPSVPDITKQSTQDDLDRLPTRLKILRKNLSDLTYLAGKSSVDLDRLSVREPGHDGPPIPLHVRGH